MDAASQHPGPWGQSRRLQFIDFRLRWDGQLNRADLTAFFNISVPQASLDLARYLDAAPTNLEYDKSSRAYVATPEFQPQFARSSARRYLADLLSLTTGVTDQTTTFLGWRPPVDVVPQAGRAIDETVLVSLIRAMRARRRVVVTYQSMSRPEPTARSLSPHAIAFDGFRWHVRAYCHLREKFQDFVLARVLTLQETGEAAVTGDDDKQWNRLLTLVLAPHPELSPAAQRALELDYGMTDGECHLPCRHALLFYALRNLRLDQVDAAPAQSQQVILKNRTELRPFIDEAMPAGQ